MTSTMTRVQASRPQDYLYDPLYTVSCYKDHVKAWSSAQNVRAVILPIYDNMFSQVATHPPHSVEIRVSRVDPSHGHNRYVPLDPSPQVTGTNRFKYFRRPLIPYTENPGGQLVYVKQPQGHGETVGLAATAVPPGTAPADAAGAAAFGGGKPVSVGVQTMFRESGAQTDPYSPEYILASTNTSTRPEILALAHLKHGQGLPAGLQEIEMIERARAKREWEKSLPAVTDDASFQRRLRMMEAMELSEWAEREKEIKRLQDRRLVVLAAALDKRNTENESQAAAKMHAIWQRKLAEKDVLRAKMDVRRAKELRKLQEKRKQVEGTLKKRDIIGEYASVTSDVYLPKMRMGIPTHTQSVMERVLAKRPTAVALAGQMQQSGSPSSSAFMDSASGNASALASAKATPGITRAAQPAVPLPALEHLESLFPASVTHASLAPPMLGSHMQTPASRKEAAMLAQLNAMDSKLREMKQRESQSQILLASGDNRPRFLRPVPKPVERVPTPCTDAPDADEDARHQIALVIQRYLRGRRVQDDMLVGKSRRAHLIEELRLELQAEKVRVAAEEDQRRLVLMREGAATACSGAVGGQGGEVSATDVDPTRQQQEVNRSLASSAAGRAEARRGPTALVGPPIATLADQVASTFEDTIQADFVGQQLDFLDREIKRLQDQQSLAAMAVLAERTRRMREAQEAGNRQRELAMRYEEDRKFRAIMQIHQGTVDSFLEEVVASSAQQAAEMRARMRVRSAIDRAKGKVHDLTPWDKEKKEAASRDDAGQSVPPETLVANLVSSFLFPETERRLVREQVAQAQQRYLLAAHRAVYGVLDEVVEAPLAGSEVPIAEVLVDEYTSDLRESSSPRDKEFSISKSEEELVTRLRPDLIVSISDSSDDASKQQQKLQQSKMPAKILSHSFEDMLKLGAEVPLPESRPSSTIPPSSSASRPSTARAGRRAAGDSRPGSSSASRHFGQ